MYRVRPHSLPSAYRSTLRFLVSVTILYHAYPHPCFLFHALAAALSGGSVCMLRCNADALGRTVPMLSTMKIMLAIMLNTI